MGYSADQLRDLDETIKGVDFDLVLIATPVDLKRQIDITQPTALVSYEFKETGGRLRSIVEGVMKRIGTGKHDPPSNDGRGR
jgi:predicted GTPase